MANNSLSLQLILCAYFVVSISLFFPHSTSALHGGGEGGSSVRVSAKHGAVVKRDQRWNVVSTESGEISAVKVSDGKDGFYHLQFITMEPNSLFLPVHLHSDMVFYVESGSGTLSWVDLEKDNDKLRQLELQTGDVYRLRMGSFFYLQSDLASDRRKLRINAIFSDSKEEIREGSSFGAYSSVRDLILGFDNRVLQAALNVDEQVIQELRSGQNQPMIVPGVAKGEHLLGVHYRIMRAFLGRMNNGMNIIDVNKKDKKNRAYNILEAKHDVENCNGYSLVVTSKQLDVLKGSDFGIFMVNLTKGAMMGPHWNPLTAEIAVVLSGRGMVHVVCPSTSDETECKNTRFRVEQGDLFVVPRYHPMTQISFNNGSLVFVGFTTTQKNNHPQYVFGAASVFQTLDKGVLATSLGVSNTTMDVILSAQREAIILECTSCAEEEERLMEQEIQREKEEEAKKREEEKARQREEEAAREQEEARKREEEEAKRREEEKREEEARQREQEEEAARQREQEEEAARQREQEEEAARQAKEEAARQREREEEAARQREQEEEAARQREQEEEAARQREQEEEAARQREQEEEAARQREKEQEEAARQREQEEAARQAEEEAARQRQQEEEAARQQEEAAARQAEEEARRQRQAEKEAARQRQQEEEAAREQEEARRQEQEAQAAREREEARRRHQEEEARGHEGGRGGGGGGGRHQGQGEGEAASSAEEQMAQREREAEAAARSKEAGGQGGGYEE